MNTVPLADAAELVMGQAPPGSSYNQAGEGLPLIAGPGDFSGESIKIKKFTTAAARSCREGDIVLGVRASIGDRARADRPYALGRGVAVVRAREGQLHPGYLWHWLGHIQPELASRGRGATFLQVTRKDIASLHIPLPPLGEQRRIAGILDEADALRAKRRRTLELLDDLTQSIFLDMFGDPDPHWPSRAIDDVAAVQGGITLNSRRSELPTRLPYLRVANVFRNRLDLSEVKRVGVTDAERHKTQLRVGDLLVVEGHGNPSEVGRVALWGGEIADCVHQNHLIRVRIESPEILPAFAVHYLNSQQGRQHLVRAGRTTSGLNTISVSKVRATPILVPPIDLQNEFEVRLRKTLEQGEGLVESSRSMDILLVSLQSRAFFGGL